MHIYYSQTPTGTDGFEVEGKRTSCRSHHKNSSIPKPQSRFHPLHTGVSLYKGGCVFYQRSTFLAQEKREPLHVNFTTKGAGTLTSYMCAGVFVQIKET